MMPVCYSVCSHAILNLSRQLSKLNVALPNKLTAYSPLPLNKATAFCCRDSSLTSSDFKWGSYGGPSVIKAGQLFSQVLANRISRVFAVGKSWRIHGKRFVGDKLWDAIRRVSQRSLATPVTVPGNEALMEQGLDVNNFAKISHLRVVVKAC
jgi:hypothetical protein